MANSAEFDLDAQILEGVQMLPERHTLNGRKGVIDMLKDQEIAQQIRKLLMLRMMRERLNQETEELKKALDKARNKSSVIGR